MNISEFFEQDHQRLDAIFEQFQQAQDIDQATELFNDFKDGLERHIGWEEQLLFPAFEVAANMPANSGPTHVMRIEHQQIKECLAAITDALTKEEKGVLMQQQLLSVLGEHNFKEENVLYPFCDRSLDEDQVQQILSQTQL